MKYYLKKCGSQELGSVEKNRGRAQRGRYLLTSKSEEVLSFFPPLTTAQLNDSALLPIIPLHNPQKIYCNFVYHNDKYHGSTAVHPRDEYRLYLNKSLEKHQMMFATDDIVIMRKDLAIEEGSEQVVYFLDIVNDHQSEMYQCLNTIVENYPIRGGYAMYEGILEAFEEKLTGVVNMPEVMPVIDDTVTERIVATEEHVLSDLFNAATFRDFVMTGYGGLCAITGSVIRYENYMNLEAAHIKPKSHGGFYLPNNGLALCRDLHWAFDKGFFTLSDDLKVMVHPSVQSEFLQSLDGQRIRTPENAFFVPAIENIHYHRKYVFGLFKTTGRL